MPGLGGDGEWATASPSGRLRTGPIGRATSDWSGAVFAAPPGWARSCPTRPWRSELGQIHGDRGNLGDTRRFEGYNAQTGAVAVVRESPCVDILLSNRYVNALRNKRPLRRANGVAPRSIPRSVPGRGPRGEPRGSYGCPSGKTAPGRSNPPIARRNPIILTCRAPPRAVFDVFFAGCLTPRRVSRARCNRSCFVVPRSENRRNGYDKGMRETRT